MTTIFRSKKTNTAVRQNSAKGGLMLTLGIFIILLSIVTVLFQIALSFASAMNSGFGSMDLSSLSLLFWAFMLAGIYFTVWGGKRLALSNTYKKLDINMEIRTSHSLVTLSHLMRSNPDRLLGDLIQMQRYQFWKAVTALDDCVVIEPFNSNVAYKVLAEKGMEFTKKEKRQTNFFLPLLAACLFVSAFLPFGFLFSVLGSLAGAAILHVVTKSLLGRTTTIIYQPLTQKAPVVVEIERSGDQLVDDVLGNGQSYLNQLLAFQPKIVNPVISGNIYDLTASMRQLMALLKEEPDKYKQIRAFTEQSLPTTIKLLNTYIELDAQPVKGANINSSMKKIEEMSTMVAKNFRQELDALYQDKSLDIEVDIEIMENILSQSTSDFPLS